MQYKLNISTGGKAHSFYVFNKMQDAILKKYQLWSKNPYMCYTITSV